MSKLRVLVIEETPDVSRSFEVLLRFKGHDVRVVDDHAAVIEVAQEFGPHLILLDVGLPTVVGIDTARSLRRHSEFATTTIVGLIAYDGQQARRLALREGFSEFLSKRPFLTDIYEMLDRASARDSKLGE